MYRRILISILFFCFNLANGQSIYPNSNDSLAFAYNWSGQYRQTLRLCDSLIRLDLGYQEIYLFAAHAAAKINKPMLEQYYLLMAEKENPADTTIQQFLFHNYINTNQYHQAARISNNTLRYLPDYALPAVHLIHAEGGAKVSSNDSLYQPLYYMQIGVGARVKQLLWYQALTHLSQQTYYGTIQQWQYYTAVQVPIKRNWVITPAFHLLSFNTSNAPAVYTESPPKGNPWVTSLNVSKNHRNLLYSLSMVYAGMNHENQFQVQPQVTWWPRYNNTLFIQLAANYLTESNTTQWCYSLGFQPLSRLTISTAYSDLHARNFVEQNGYLVNNAYDKTQDRFQVMAVYRFNHGWTPYGLYQLENKIESTTDLAYRLNMFMFGIRKTI